MKEKEKLTNSKSGGGIYNKINAFTLIELLAIIVILAIIAVITVPIILNVIENAKKGAAVDSAYGYKDAIEKYYVSEMIDRQDLKLSGTYTVEKDGSLKKASEEHPISTSGDSPSGGWISIENNESTYFCLTIGDYRVKLKNGDITAEKGECKFGGKVVTNETDEKIPSTGHTGVKAIVYLDPTDLTTQCDKEVAITTKGITFGCMKWYVFEEDYYYYTMISDHNILHGMAWVTLDDYKQGDSTITNVYNNKGPITALKQLKTATNDWNIVESFKSIDNYIAEWTDENGTNQKYTIDYNGYKAKLISAEKLNEITQKGSTRVSNIVAGYFDNSCENGNCIAGNNPYGWLFDHLGQQISATNAISCESYGCNAGETTDPLFYWTSTPIASTSNSAWMVGMSGELTGDNTFVNAAYPSGIRPVIKVSKSLLQKQN